MGREHAHEGRRHPQHAATASSTFPCARRRRASSILAAIVGRLDTLDRPVQPLRRGSRRQLPAADPRRRHSCRASRTLTGAELSAYARTGRSPRRPDRRAVRLTAPTGRRSASRASPTTSRRCANWPTPCPRWRRCHPEHPAARRPVRVQDGRRPVPQGRVELGIALPFGHDVGILLEEHVGRRTRACRTGSPPSRWRGATARLRARRPT
ncbi:MAG: hypothetical protein MZV64_42990 [Ignavibacteriales bacterium]|nr:hypothetical protein [Ignavibacteriales bacterium]